MTPRADRAIRLLVEAATVDLFNTHRLYLRPGIPHTRPTFTRTSMAGRVTFQGAVDGVIVIASTFALFEKTRPAELRAAPLRADRIGDVLVIRDWAAEVANQLVGRVRNRLFSLGVTLKAGRPTAVSGEPMMGLARTMKTEPLWFAGGGDDVWVWWESTSGTDVELGGRGGDEGAGEGAVLLF